MEPNVGKKKAEVTTVKMEDGREVGFAGKRKVMKETLIDESKIVLDGDTVTLAAGAISVRMDFRNGATRTFPLPLNLLAQFAGHGGEQKYGDELASPADKPLSEEDMVLAVESLNEQIQRGDWRAVREGGGGGVSGASIVVQAVAQISGKTVQQIKDFIQSKLDAAKARGEKLTRNEVYAAFRKPGTPTGELIAKMEAEKAAKSQNVQAEDLLAELG